MTGYSYKQHIPFSRVAPGLYVAAVQRFDDALKVSHNKVAEKLAADY